MSSQNNQKPKKKPSQSKNPSKQVKNKVVRKAVKQANFTDQVMTKQAQMVVESIASPKDAPAVRLGTVYGSFETAVANPWQRCSPGWADLQSAGSIDDMFAAVFRDPYCAAIIPTKNGGTASQYGASFNQRGAQNYLPVNFPYLAYQGGGAQVHGPALFAGRKPSQTMNYFYVGTGTVTMQNTNATAQLNVIVQLFREDIDSALDVVSINIGTTATIVSGQPLGTYFAVTIATPSNGAQLTGALTVNYAANTVVWGHYAINNILNNSASAEAFKVYGASIMYTNTASPLNRQGKIAGVQLPAGSFYSQYTYYDAIADLESAVSLDIVNGIYGFLKPTQPSDINFQAFDTVTTNNISTNAWWPLRRTSDFLMIAAKVLSSSNGQDGYLTFAHAFEYRTTDLWRDVELASISPNTVDFAMMLVSRCPQWHENPLHLSDIWNWVKKTSTDIYNGVKDALPDVVKGATTVAKIGGALIPLML